MNQTTDFPASPAPKLAFPPARQHGETAGSLTDWFYQLAETALNGTAYRLAWLGSDGYVTSEYAYLAPEAAEQALPILNRARAARGHEMYSHLVEFAGDRCINVRELEATA